MGSKKKGSKCEIYIINGYRFHTRSWGQGMKSYNSGVCVHAYDGGLEDDFYGILTDIIELEYYGHPHKMLVVFKCEWFDNTPDGGTNVDNKYGIVEVRQ